MAQVNYLEQTIDRAGSTIVDAVFLAQKQNFMIENNITDESELTDQQLARLVEDAKFATAFSVTLFEEYGSLSGKLSLAQLQQVDLYKGVAGHSLGALATYIEAKPYLQNPDGTYSLANIARVIGSISLSSTIDVLGSKIAGAPGVAITNGANIALGARYKKVVGPIYIAEFDEEIDKVTLKTADDLSTMLERHYESAFFGLIGEGLDEHARWEIIQDTTSGQKDALEYDSSVYHFKNHSWSEFDQPTNYFTSPLARLLQYLEVSNIRIKDNTTEKNILFNALSDAAELSVSSTRSNDKKFYAVQALKPYVTSSDPYQNTYVPLYSDAYIKDRVDFLNRLIDGTGAYESIRYEDTELGIRTDDGTAPGGGAVPSSVLFTDEDVMASNSTLAYHIYGKDSAQIIQTAKYREWNDYVEGGDGRDTIYTYGGDDTIFTNADVAREYDGDISTNTVYAGDGEDKVYGSNGTDIIYADSDSAANPNQYDNRDLVEGRGGSDKIYGGDGRDTLYADSASSHADTSGDYIVGGLGADTIHGSDGDDTIFGDTEGDESSLVFSDKDVIHGYGGSDTLYGGTDKDTLMGGMENGTDDGANDYLEGGDGFDTYIVNNGDTIMDSDGEGLVKFDNIDLTGQKEKNEETGRYQDYDYYYDGDPDGTGPLIVTTLDGSKSITINDWSNEDLGIELVDQKEIEVRVSAQGKREGDLGRQDLKVTITLSGRELKDGEALEVTVPDTYEGSYTFTSGQRNKIFHHLWTGDIRYEGSIDHAATFTPTASYDGPYDDVEVKILNSVTVTVTDDDEDKRHDPLALDTNQDGFISTTDLDVSGTYFDITGDGLKERVGWIKSEDALLTYDKNENGDIDGIDEVFGNMSESGFEELKRLIDSNHDNIIDRRDELFNRLQVWNDKNGLWHVEMNNRDFSIHREVG